jgi:sulfite dehydrogenase (quinone) subunit SoeC
MHPAKSVIVFTVLSGSGFGLIFLLGLGYGIQGGAAEAGLVCASAVALSAIGLLSSTFHLGHPERAWRAFTQWRSSWLSREGVLSVFTLTLFALYALVWVAAGRRLAFLGALSALGAFATVAATAMIYAQLKTVPLWRSALTPACYLAFALASGASIAGAFSSKADFDGAPAALILAAFLLAAWIVKFAWWTRAEKASLASLGSTRESATGLGSLGAVRLLERPHTGPNYLTKEMVYVIARKHAKKLRLISAAFGLAVPLAICLIDFAASASSIWLLLGWAPLIFGLLVERWLFFAEAQHSVSLYY